MRRLTLLTLLVLTFCLAGFAQQLSVFVVDTEGGKATLIVTPQKESLLLDAGWPYGPRDADRIVAAAKSAGLSKIDYLLVTHYHVDHVGGVPWVIERMPVANVIEHGPTVEHDLLANEMMDAYARSTAKIPHIVVKPGDKLPLKGVDIEVVAGSGTAIKRTGQNPNPLCADAVTRSPENDENDQSIGILLTYGQFRMVDLADLTAGKERDLFCPANSVGKVDVLMISHHGLDRSNSPLMIGSLQPRVAIMNNGAVKGGSPAVVKALTSTKGVDGVWLLHAVSGGDVTITDKYVANPEANCKGYGIKLTAGSDGAFAVTNQRTGATVTYVSAR